MVNIPNLNEIEPAAEIPYYFIEKNETLLRVYKEVDRTNYGLEKFRSVKKACRFDHHNSDPNDEKRRIIYTAKTLSCCLVECFGDTRIIRIEGIGVAKITTNRELVLLDLRKSAAMRLGCAAAISSIIDRETTQLWSRHFYERTDLFGHIDGLLYVSAHNGEDAIALYERCEDALSATPTNLADKHWRQNIIQTMKKNHMRKQN
jgi:RES domain